MNASSIPPTLLLGFSDYQAPAERLANQLDMPFGLVDCHIFPDDERRIRLPFPIAETVIFCRTLNQPNEKLIELMLAAGSARANGAKQLILVAPYLCYQRQDIAFQPGEAISQAIIGDFLARYFDVVVTVDPHLHRVHSLDQVIPCQHVITETAGLAMAAFVKQNLNNPLLVGPDSESEQWVGSMAQPERLEYIIAAKQRYDDHNVAVTLPEFDYQGRQVVLIDDMISTGNTVAETSQRLYQAGVHSVDALVTHPLFISGAKARIQQAGVRHIWSCDTIEEPSNVIELAPLLATALAEWLSD